MPALPEDMASRLWHLVRIAGIHNGDRESKDVQRAFESVVAALAQRERETISAMTAVLAYRHGLLRREAEEDGLNPNVRLIRQARMEECQDAADMVRALAGDGGKGTS